MPRFLDYNFVMKNSGTFRFFLYGLSVILIISVNLNTFSSFHDSQLFPVKGELGYKKRGNRYEGFYEKKCSGCLEIVSLMYRLSENLFLNKGNKSLFFNIECS
jgi:hypothetical protein